uniref:Uncharacterized protein n=1 Tax=Lepeophtheirus salmonis TaxID=72036 RepID=A0A0K2UZ06_LEPSM
MHGFPLHQLLVMCTYSGVETRSETVWS